MTCVNDFRLRFGNDELVPIIVGGMGVDISAAKLALEVCRLGGIGHISDAMMPAVTDRHHQTRYVKDKIKQFKYNVASRDKSLIKFDLDQIRAATLMHVRHTMEAKTGPGKIFINCMEKLTMNNPKETLRTRLAAAMDGGIDGITLSAGLHLSSFDLIKDHPKFRHTLLGIIVSSVRALKLFLKRSGRLDRHPDYIIVEGPLAGGHLGFGMDWADKKYELHGVFAEIRDYLDSEQLEIPLIAAGGVFTGGDAVSFLEAGAAAVQVATRFTIARECGLPDNVKQEYLKANEEDIEVNLISPTGYPMRMISSSPSIDAGIRPNCEAFGYLLDRNGHCAYIDAYNAEVEAHPDAKKITVHDKTCLCTHMRNFDCWTCGQYAYRLKDTTNQLADGSYQLPTAQHIFEDYQFSEGGQVRLPEPETG